MHLYTIEELRAELSAERERLAKKIPAWIAAARVDNRICLAASVRAGRLSRAGVMAGPARRATGDKCATVAPTAKIMGRNGKGAHGGRS